MMQLRFDGDSGGGGAGSVSVGGKLYRLKQVHWHSPSEHTVDGRRFPVELHMVHASDDGNVTVVAMLYRFGRPDPLLWQVLNLAYALMHPRRRRWRHSIFDDSNRRLCV